MATLFLYINKPTSVQSLFIHLLIPYTITIYFTWHDNCIYSFTKLKRGRIWIIIV